MDYVLTNDGAALMTEAVTGKKLIFTRAETGKGYSSSPAMLKSIAGRQQNLDMEVSHEGSDVKITCFLTNRQLEEGYVMKQLGVYAKLEGEETDTLVVIGQQYSGEMIHPYADGEAEYEFIILMKASGTSSIIVESGAGSLVTKRELNAHVNRMDNPHGVTAEQIGLGKVQNVAPEDMVIEFEQTEERGNIEGGEELPVLFGKIKRWFSDLKDSAFSAVANNCTTTEKGSVLDARQGKILQEGMEEIREEVNGALDQLKKSVADGKALIASAITSKGVSTAAGAAFGTMADNIGEINNILKRTLLGTNNIGNHNASPADTWRTTTFNATSIPGYDRLTANNFVAVPDFIANLSPSTATTYPRCRVGNISYNPGNGIVTVDYNIKAWAVAGSAYWEASIKCFVFYV